MSSQTVSVVLREWESATPENQGESLKGQNFGSDEAARNLARRLTRDGRLEVTELARGLHIRARSFVGRVQLGHWQITVQPKIPAAPLLDLLRYPTISGIWACSILLASVWLGRASRIC